MKKICLFFLGMFFMANTIAFAGKCEDAGGSIISNVPRPSTVGGTMTLCLSGHSMNFFSAAAWCKAVGGKLIGSAEIEITEKLNDSLTDTSPLTGVNKSIWTAYFHPKYAQSHGYTSSGISRAAPNTTKFAACVMDVMVQCLAGEE